MVLIYLEQRPLKTENYIADPFVLFYIIYFLFADVKTQIDANPRLPNVFLSNHFKINS